MEELRIVLVGKTGVGKSSAGNTILGRTAFETSCFGSSMTSKCSKKRGTVNMKEVDVIDTPGVFDNNMTQKETLTEIKQCICFSAPGPHVFLVVIEVGRFTQEEQDTVEIIKATFGDQAEHYTMVLFSHGDKLKGLPIEDFLQKSSKINNFVKKCHGGYFVFNNEDKNPSQVTQLLHKIDKMVKVNGGGFYTTEMLQEAERAIEEAKKKILEENAVQRLKEENELEKTFKNEHQKELNDLRLEHERKARERAERENNFMKRGAAVFATATAFAAAYSGGTGGMIGQQLGNVLGVASGGPVGAIAGGIVGGIAGGLVGAGVGAASTSVSDKCSTQ